MGIYRLTPHEGSSVLIQAGNLARANALGLREFPAGMLRSAEAVSVRELAALEAEGVPLPVTARQRVEVYRAVMRERAKASARMDAMREKSREKVRAKREEEAEKRAELRAQQRAERDVEKKRKAAAARRAKQEAEKREQQQQPPAPVLAIDHDDSRLPWE